MKDVQIVTHRVFQLDRANALTDNFEWSLASRAKVVRVRDVMIPSAWEVDIAHVGFGEKRKDYRWARKISRHC